MQKCGTLRSDEMIEKYSSAMGLSIEKFLIRSVTTRRYLLQNLDITLEETNSKNQDGLLFKAINKNLPLGRRL